jgi:hypothetical protein
VLKKESTGITAAAMLCSDTGTNLVLADNCFILFYFMIVLVPAFGVLTPNAGTSVTSQH